MKKNIVILLIGVIMFSCSGGLKVTSEVDPTTDFSAFETLEYFGWQEDSKAKVMSFYRTNLEKSFANEFLNRGIKAVKKGEGDIIVSLHLVINTRVEEVATTTSTNMANVNTYPVAYGPPGMYAYGGSYGNVGIYGYGGMYGFGPNYAWAGGHPPSVTTYSDHTFEDGTLIVSVYNAKKKELIWEATGSKPLNVGVEDPDVAVANMQKTVAEIMKKYPVKPKK